MKDYVLVNILGQAKTYDGNGTVNVYHSGIRKALIKASEIITIYEVNENTFSMKVTYQATPTTSHAYWSMMREEMGGVCMPNDHRGTSEPSDGLYGPCFVENHYGDYRPSQQSNSIRANGATLGGEAKCLSSKSR